MSVESGSDRSLEPAAESANPLLDALQAMTETQFSRTVVIPLLTALYPEAYIEETHGSQEAGRDIICRTNHPTLNRTLVICVQVKNHPLSTGATAGPYSIAAVVNQFQIAKTTGVCATDGTTLRPDEVWLVNSYPFSEPQRRETRDMIVQLKTYNGHLIVGTEFASLLQRHCPSLTSQLARWPNSRLAQAIASLSVHHESRAFGLRTDRILDDFHVIARICPSTTLASEVLSGAIGFFPYSLAVKWTTDGGAADSLAIKGDSIDPADIDRSTILKDFAPLVSQYKIPTAWNTKIDRQPSVLATREYRFNLPNLTSPAAVQVAEILSDVTALSVSWNATVGSIPSNQTAGYGLVVEDADRNRSIAELLNVVGLKNDRQITWTLSHGPGLGPKSDACTITRVYKFDLPGVGSRICKDLKAAFRAMPKKVGSGQEAVSRLVQQVREVDRFVSTCRELGVARSVDADQAFSRPSILVEDESQLVALAPRLLIDGDPGSGKTTLLRRTAISLLKQNSPVFYVPCAQVEASERLKPLKSIAKRLAIKGTPPTWSPDEALVLVDGLDEAPFDMSDCISKTNGPLIASVRRAFETPLRGDFARIELGPFTVKDRTAFFSRWFAGNIELRERAESLVKRHADLDAHTRLPLLTTLVAALIDRGFSPTSRNDIYNDRLDLLLGRWDSARGVARSYVPSDVKIRFLEYLAYLVHSLTGRRRFDRETIAQAFAEGMGLRGKSLELDKVIHDLVVSSGVLVREGAEFSFGHLTFQEHLAARRLKRIGRPEKVVRLLGSAWWREVLLFYAGEIGDITEIIDACEKQPGISFAHVNLLHEMIKHAPYTQQIASEVLHERRRTARMSQLAEEEKEQEDAIEDEFTSDENEHDM